MKKVLILCTGNSCRSIMAEALINHYLNDKWSAYSAGVSFTRVHPLTLKVLQEIGVDVSSLRSKSVNEFINRDDLDLVITVCDNAKESCPLFLKPVMQVHIGIPDPAAFTDLSEVDKLNKFREIRDLIKTEILQYLQHALP